MSKDFNTVALTIHSFSSARLSAWRTAPRGFCTSSLYILRFLMKLCVLLFLLRRCLRDNVKKHFCIWNSKSFSKSLYLKLVPLCSSVDEKWDFPSYICSDKGVSCLYSSLHFDKYYRLFFFYALGLLSLGHPGQPSYVHST